MVFAGGVFLGGQEKLCLRVLPSGDGADCPVGCSVAGLWQRYLEAVRSIRCVRSDQPMGGVFPCMILYSSVCVESCVPMSTTGVPSGIIGHIFPLARTGNAAPAAPSLEDERLPGCVCLFP